MLGSHLISEGMFWYVVSSETQEIQGQSKQKHTFRAMKTDNGPARVKIPVGLTEVTMAST